MGVCSLHSYDMKKKTWASIRRLYKFYMYSEVERPFKLFKSALTHAKKMYNFNIQLHPTDRLL